MANVLVLGGGFGGVVAAERMAKMLGTEHELTLVSNNARFTFYPALVRLAFGKCEPDDVSFDLRGAGKVTLTGSDITGDIKYDFLLYALGRRLATERVPGFFEHAHHLLSVKAALRFGEAVKHFRGGHVVVGSCPGARLEVPVYETAFALARRLREQGREARITVVSSDYPGEHPGGAALAAAARPALEAHHIESLNGFEVHEVRAKSVHACDGRALRYDLLMLVPPFEGTSALTATGLTDVDGYVRVDHTMRVLGAERMYAAGDAVYFSGPKMGHMAVRQAEVAAANLAAEIEGREPSATYHHEMTLVVDEGGGGSAYLRKNLWDEDGGDGVRHGRFWGWAKRAQEKYFNALHS